MKTAGVILLLVAIVLFVGQIAMGIRCNYVYSKDVGSFWELADKTSTIKAKSEYIDKFVAAIESNIDVNDYNAVFMKTPNNYVKTNLEALKTLQSRLKEIQKIDIQSFAYQTAIQQITAQEQGEAKEMIAIFYGVYTKNHYIFNWQWVGLLFMCSYLILGAIAIQMIIYD